MKKLKLNLKQASQSDIDAILKEASSVIAAGGLVIYPTETTYGIGADPNNSHAIDKLLAYKSRREGKPLSVAVSDQNMAKRYVNINQQAQNFYQRFLPGAYTVISQLKNDSPIDQRVASEFKTLGIRIPNYPLVLNWLKKMDQGITATSANVSDQKRPYNIDEILEKLPSKQKNLIGSIPISPSLWGIRLMVGQNHLICKLFYSGRYHNW